MSDSWPFEGNLHFDGELLKMKSLNLQTHYVMVVYQVREGRALQGKTELKKNKSFSRELLISACRQMMSWIRAHLHSPYKTVK